MLAALARLEEGVRLWMTKPVEAPDLQAARDAIAAAKSVQPLTQLEFSERDHEIAEEMAARLGYKQTAYTSTSALWGLFCLPENPATAHRGEATRGGCIIRTVELGLLFVQCNEDLGNDDLLAKERAS